MEKNQMQEKDSAKSALNHLVSNTNVKKKMANGKKIVILVITAK